MSITTRLNTKIIDVGGGDKWIKFYGNPVARKVGLREMVKTCSPDGKTISDISYRFSDNPLVRDVLVHGTPEKMRKIWSMVLKMGSPKEVVDNLTALSKIMGKF